MQSKKIDAITSTSKSRTIHTSGVKTKQKFRFRWWIAVILVVAIAGIGIAVLRFSHASVMPPEELAKIDAGVVIKRSLPCSVEYPPYGYNRVFSVQECIAATNPEGYSKLYDMVISDLEKIYIKNHPVPITPAPTPSPATKSSSNKTNSSSSSNTQTPSSGQGTDQSTSVVTGNDTQPQNIAAIDNSSTPTIQQLPVVKDLGTLSGFVKVNFVPQNPDTVKVMALFVNNTLVEELVKSPYTFGFDTSRFPNGNYKLAIAVLNKDNTIAQSNYTAQFKNSSIDRFLYSLSFPIQFFTNR